MTQAAAVTIGKSNIALATTYAVIIFVVSFAGVFALGGAAWVIPITLGHIAALAFVKSSFAVPSFTNLSTKIVFTLLACISLLFAAAGTQAEKEKQKPPIPEIDVSAAPADEASVAPSLPVPPPETAPTPVSPPTQSAPIAKPPIREVRTTVDDILQTYAENQIAGERKFGNSKVVIQGTAVRVREVLGTGILVLASRRSGASMELSFSEAGNSSLADVKPRQLVTAECYSAYEAMGAVLLGDCRSVK